jgi:hypothetical protein
VVTSGFDASLVSIDFVCNFGWCAIERAEVRWDGGVDLEACDENFGGLGGGGHV